MALTRQLAAEGARHTRTDSELCRAIDGSSRINPVRQHQRESLPVLDRLRNRRDAVRSSPAIHNGRIGWSDSSAARTLQILKYLLQNLVQAGELRIAQVVERLLKNPSGLCTHLFDGLPALRHQQHLGHSSISR
jgi:hypothetical protein